MGALLDVAPSACQISPDLARELDPERVESATQAVNATPELFAHLSAQETAENLESGRAAQPCPV